MTSINWGWDDYWSWWVGLENKKDKVDGIRQVLDEGWMIKLSAESQAKVFLHAPIEIKQILKNHSPNLIKKETLLLLQMEQDRMSKKLKRLNKRR